MCRSQYHGVPRGGRLLGLGQPASASCYRHSHSSNWHWHTFYSCTEWFQPVNSHITEKWSRKNCWNKRRAVLLYWQWFAWFDSLKVCERWWVKYTKIRKNKSSSDWSVCCVRHNKQYQKIYFLTESQSFAQHHQWECQHFIQNSDSLECEFRFDWSSSS